MLSGKELFNYNAALFVDDDEAINAEEENALNQESRLEAEEEEARSKAEAERAQAEQMRMMEMVKLEEEENEREDEERRVLAYAEGHETFLLGSIVINKLVFDVRVKEDLEPFLYDQSDDDDEEDGDDECGDGDSDEEADEGEGEEGSDGGENNEEDDGTEQDSSPVEGDGDNRKGTAEIAVALER